MPPAESVDAARPAPLEVVTAFTDGDDDPELSRQRLAVVLDGPPSGRDASWAQAEPLFGLARPAGELAAEHGCPPATILSRIAGARLAG